MKPEIDTNKIKRKVYLTYFQDGLWDIMLGLFLLAWGFTVWFDLPWLPGATFIAFFWLVLGLKQKITYPRIGYARPAEYRQRALKIVIAGVVVLVAVVFLLPIINRSEMQFLHNYFELLFSTMMAIAFALIAYWWRIYRWYLYAAMVFVFSVFNQWSEFSFSMSFIMPGVIITLCGLTILYRFLHNYPVIVGESIAESQ
jgi:hypothetical protein